MSFITHRPRAVQRLAADRVLNAARVRFRRLPRAHQPASAPTAIMTLFSQPELWLLASSGRWPLRPQDLHYVTGRRAAEGVR
jgi:hypothetical protein